MTSHCAEIDRRLHDILRERFSLDIPAERNGENLLGRDIGLTPNLLVYLVYIAEQEFDMRFAPEDFDREAFYTLEGFVSIVAERMRQ